MPLLGRKVVTNMKPLADVKPEDKIFTIEHTQEQFKSEDEYEKRLKFYAERQWTCQCTGHINLTHQEAHKSEQENYELLTKKFPAYFEKPILELVHHNTELLDNLVDQGWTKLQQAFVVDEPVILKIKAMGKQMQGVVARVDCSVDAPQVDHKSTSNCSSPSSDKENSAANNINTEDKPVENGIDGESPKKWTPPKLLPYKYDVRLEEQDKIISGIPAVDLARAVRTPSKDLVKLFVRSYALRHGMNQNSPWVVNEKMVNKYNIPSKFADFFLSPSKVKENGKKEVPGKKRKSSISKSESSASKKIKLDKSLSESSNKKGASDATPGTPKKRGRPPSDKSATPKSATPKKRGRPPKDPNSVTTPKKATPKKQPSTPVKSSPGGENSGNETPRKRGRPKGSKDKSPRKSRKTPQSTPKKMKAENAKSQESSDSDSSDDEITLADLKEGKSSTPSSPKAKVVSPKKTASLKKSGSVKKAASPKKGKSLADLKKELKKKEQEKKKKQKQKQKEKEKAKKSEGLKKKGLKQMTLFDMKGGKGRKPKTPQATPKKSPNKSPRKQASPYKLPPLAVKLQKAMRENVKNVVNQLVAKCARDLSSLQRNRLPPELKEVVQKKWEGLEERKKIANMTPAQREKYMTKKREEMRQKMRKMKAEQNRRFEDTELDLAKLPSPKLVSTPDGLANEHFGDVAMVTEFINCYKGLLMGEEQQPIMADKLMKGLCSGKEGFGYLSHVLTILLQTLLQDGIAEDYKELGLALSSLTITQYSASEVVRLCLRKHDTKTRDSDDDEGETIIITEESEVPDAMIDQLETQEIYALQPEEQLQILTGLCLRIMGSYSVQDYMETRQREAAELWKRRMRGQKKRNDLKKEEKQKKKEDKGKDVKKEVKEEENKEKKEKEGMTITDFYGKDAVDEEPADLASVVKRRRVMAAKAAAEKTNREREERIRMKKEQEEMKVQKEEEQFEKEFAEGVLCAKQVFRHIPIGTDRSHSRYWVFQNALPGLYIEKGWAPKDVGYNVQSGDHLSESSSESESDSDSENDKSDESDRPKRGRRSRGYLKTCEKTMRDRYSIPHVGQNLWFMYDSVEDLKSVLANLHDQGVRESYLKVELRKVYDQLEKGITGMQKKSDAAEVNMSLDVVEGFRDDLLDMEMRLRNGGLGGVNKFQDWEKKLNEATTIEQFGECLIETQAHIVDKFLKGQMAPRKVKKVKEVKEEEDNEEKEEEEEEEEEEYEMLRMHADVVNWVEAIRECPTFSRLHILLSMMDTCIKWEKSAENAKCKICRKKGEEEKLLLCDECNQAFHLYCMRPALLEVPTGDWYCPACIPTTVRKRSRGKDYRQLAGESPDEESASEEEKGMVNEENCAVCGGDEGLVNCSTCPSAFHFDCHEPQLRRTPREGVWRCMQCTTGIRIKRSRTHRPVPAKRKMYVDESSDEEYNSGPVKKRTLTNSRNTKNSNSNLRRSSLNDSRSRKTVEVRTSSGRVSRRREQSSSEDMSSSEEEESSDGYTRIARRKVPTKTGRPRGRPSKKKQQSSSEEEEEEEEISEEEEDEDSQPQKRRLVKTSSGRVSKPKQQSSDEEEDETEEDEASGSETEEQESGEEEEMDWNKEKKIMIEIIYRLMKNRHSWPFHCPVDAEEVPDYYEIVKNPMDLQTIRTKVSEEYKDSSQFINDIALMLDNAELYNKPDSEVGHCIGPFEKAFLDMKDRHLPRYGYRRDFSNPLLFEDHAYTKV